MKIYVAHSRTINFIDDLYNPIINSQKLKEYSFYFSHSDNTKETNNNYNFYKQFDLIIAEVSQPSTGLGIELGWTNILQIPILCIYKKGSKITNSLNTVTNKYIEYINDEDLVDKIHEFLNK